MKTPMNDESPSHQGEHAHRYPGYLPDCRAKELSCSIDFVECLNRPHCGCPYLLSFGWGTYCFHPNRMQIVRTTERA